MANEDQVAEDDKGSGPDNSRGRGEGSGKGEVRGDGFAGLTDPNREQSQAHTDLTQEIKRMW